MKYLKLVLVMLFCVAGLVYAQAPKPDNTKVNKRDQNPGQLTADQQKENAADRDLTKRIRRSIMADKSLSSYAHNIKIITVSGEVTLKGPVKSDDERKAVLAKAVAVAGNADRVTDQMAVKQ
jgi:osmotically-inducible protein OsmY